MTFANYVKRYKSENDELHAARKEKYAKKRRRWARKDLVSRSQTCPLPRTTADLQKQRRRAKARADLDEADDLVKIDHAALHFDYMSSEHSSPGSDSSDEDEGWHAEKLRRRAESWASMAAGAGSKESADLTLETSGVDEHMIGGSEPVRKSGWAPGLTSKVLEVRTPSWRSVKVRWC